MQNYSPNVKAVIGYLPLKFEIPQHPRYTARLLSKHLFGYKRDITEGGCLFCDVLLLADQSQPFQWTPGMTQGRMETLVTPLANGVGLNTDSDVWLTFLLLSFSITLHRESVSPIVKLVLNLLKRSLETHTILG